ncbi:MAG: S8 family serine peptidase [Flavobacterium sp.]
MRTTINKIFFTLFLCGGVLGVSAQNQDETNGTDSAIISELSQRFTREYNERYQKAVEMAKQNGWPLRIEKPDGTVAILQDLFEGRSPLYIGTTNEGSAITSRVDKIRPGGSLGLNLDGAGMNAGVWEIDRPLETHLDLQSATGAKRLFKADAGTGEDKTTVHPTHVCGTIASLGKNSADFSGRGMAPNTNRVYYADIKNDLAEMADVYNRFKVTVSNHSYGPAVQNGEAAGFYKSIFGTYMKDSKDFDDMCFASPYYQPLSAAGNDRSYQGGDHLNPGKNGHDLMSKWCTAKNSLVVAAVYEALDYTGASSVKMSNFSNWGPTDDNRIKPTISAKGVRVFSTSSTSNTAYEYLDGTSMATPGVTGALLLLQQHYSNLFDKKNMLSATVRGLVAHTADEAGDFPGPDSKFGYGLLNVEKAAKILGDKAAGRTVVDERTLSQEGVYTTTVYATGTEPLIATISWTEKGSAAVAEIDSSTPVLINDLDIRVTKDEETYFPWRLNSTIDVASEKADNIVDNIEKVEIELPEPGIYTITVSHKGLLTGSNGLADHSATQNYSLIVSGTDQTLNVEKNDFKVFNVWPNPVVDVINVSVASDLNEDAFVTLYDIQGKRLMSQKMSESSDRMSGVLNAGNLIPGIYLVKVTQGEKQSVRKIVKK